MGKTRYTLDDIERLLSHIGIAEDGCWEWLAAKLDNGYGTWGLRGVQTTAHRHMWQAVWGDIPSGKQLDHLCRNRTCVNPEHMEPVTILENIMRGQGVMAINAKKTHCVHGHEFTPENTYIRPPRRRGRLERGCKACVNIRKRKARIPIWVK